MGFTKGHMTARPGSGIWGKRDQNHQDVEMAVVKTGKDVTKTMGFFFAGVETTKPQYVERPKTAPQEGMVETLFGWGFPHHTRTGQDVVRDRAGAIFRRVKRNYK